MERKKQGTSFFHSSGLWSIELGCTEKLDDAKARARVKAQIEADKRERAEKAAKEKALREGAPLPQEPETGTSAAAPPKPAVAGKDFPETRLQIRMASGGQPYVTTLSSDASECISRSNPRSKGLWNVYSSAGGCGVFGRSDTRCRC